MNEKFKNTITMVDNIEIQVLISLKIDDINEILEYKSYLSPSLISSYENEVKYMKELLHKLEELFAEGYKTK